MEQRRRLSKWFAVLGVVVVALVVWAALMATKPAKQQHQPPVPVTVATATVEDIPVTVSALGAAQAWQAVTITAQASGRLTYVAQEGADVRAGELLAQIDPSLYQANLAQAQGALTRDQAMLADSRAVLARYQALLAQDSISRQQADSQAALVHQQEGLVAIDRGAVQAAQVNLGYCRIISPVSGRVGVRLIDPGNVVQATGTAGIISVNQIEPIAVTFTVPQGDFQRLSNASGAFSRPLTTIAISPETGQVLGTGELTIADNHVDQSTGTVALKARFPNPSRDLWPGQFVQVKLQLQTLPQAVVIPAAAVNQGPNGAYAYVVGADGKAHMRPLTVTLIQDTVAVIQSGVKPGEKVVSDGQMLLRPESQVAVRSRPAAAPAGRQGSSS